MCVCMHFCCPDKPAVCCDQEKIKSMGWLRSRADVVDLAQMMVHAEAPDDQMNLLKILQVTWPHPVSGYQLRYYYICVAELPAVYKLKIILSSISNFLDDF